MAYQIEYAYTCHLGKVRVNNEDNFWCCGKYLDAYNQGSEGIAGERISQSRLPLMAVFDGMGGESCGEVAAYLAADSCEWFYEENKREIRKNPQRFLEECCYDMNDAVCEYSARNKIRSMGTTAAMIAFGRDGIYTCNLGDSRIYQFLNGQFRQISTDHVMRRGMFGKPPLTQYVGIPEETMGLDPALEKNEYAVGARYLLCTDGVTDMLPDEEIAELLARKIPVKECAELLLEGALKKGGRDNTTIILCEITEDEKQSRVRKWLERLGWKKQKGDMK